MESTQAARGSARLAAIISTPSRLGADPHSNVAACERLPTRFSLFAVAGRGSTAQTLCISLTLLLCVEVDGGECRHFPKHFHIGCGYL